MANVTLAQSQAPLSAIDWLSQPGLQSITTPTHDDEDVTGVTANLIDVQELAPVDAPAYGLIPAHISGIPKDFWTDQNATALRNRLKKIGYSGLPATHDLYLRALLSETIGGEDVIYARAEALLDRGAVHAAQNLLGQVQINTVELFSVFAEASLLTSNEQPMCRMLVQNRRLSDDDALFVYCLARVGEWDKAVLNFFALDTLGAFDTVMSDLLSADLEPELSENIVLPAAQADDITALEFRLRQGVGQPAATRSLSLKFSVTDLEEKSGWKTQLEAAERLAVIGSLPAAKFLEIYSMGRRSASGGVWDRVEAVSTLSNAVMDPSQHIADFNAILVATSPKRLSPVVARGFARKLVGVPAHPTAEGARLKLMLLAQQSGLSFNDQLETLTQIDEDIQVAKVQRIKELMSSDFAISMTFTSSSLIELMEKTSDAVDGDFNAMLVSLELALSMGLRPLAEQMAIEYLILDAT